MFENLQANVDGFGKEVEKIKMESGSVLKTWQISQSECHGEKVVIDEVKDAVNVEVNADVKPTVTNGEHAEKDVKATEPDEAESEEVEAVQEVEKVHAKKPEVEMSKVVTENEKSVKEVKKAGENVENLKKKHAA